MYFMPPLWAYHKKLPMTDERTPLSIDSQEGNIYQSINLSDQQRGEPISSFNELLSHCSKCWIVVYYAAISILLIGLLIVVFFGSFISLTDEKITPWSSKNWNSSSASCSNLTCGISTTKCQKSSLLKIIGGQAAESCSWPWKAALYQTYDDGRTLRFLCGASIVGQNWLLTAAHCLKNQSRFVRRFRALLAKSQELENSDGDGLYDFLEIWVHPLFDKETMYYDLALLKLSRPVSCHLRSPICLPLDSQDLPKPGSKVTIIGWGVTSPESRQPSQTLEQAEIFMIDRSVCSDIYGSIIDYDYNFCAGYLSGEKDTCQGDSGGPLMYKNPENQQWTLVGLTSWGDGCAKALRPGVYTRISGVVPWIRETMMKN